MPAERGAAGVVVAVVFARLAVVAGALAGAAERGHVRVQDAIERVIALDLRVEVIKPLGDAGGLCWAAGERAERRAHAQRGVVVVPMARDGDQPVVDAAALED